AMVWLVGGCAQKKLAPLSPEDNPAHHYLMGMELIDKGDLNEASVRFERALKLEPDYSPALAGQALAAAMRVEAEKDVEHRTVELKRALDLLDDSLDEAEGDSQEFIGEVTGIRVYTHARPSKWVRMAEKAYNRAVKLKKVKSEELPYYQALSAADYFMGVAYFKALRFRDSEASLAKVAGSPPGRWHELADRLYRRVQKITRASASFTLTDVAKKIAVKDKVNRADVAALLVDEVHLDRFLAGRIPVPRKESKDRFVPADISGSMFKPEIMTVLKWGLRGLEPVYDKTSRAYLFYPERPVTRKELAFILEDLLVKIEGDQSLTTKYYGQKNSPYPDVPPTSSYFNSVTNAVTRGLMEPDLSGAFRPDDDVDGAELLLAVLRLRNVMNTH
ncbi:MAG: S-layer homology domain-containing protein, partial [Deltaproteobacteria bacterium]|nr:S-layer homology domain-containing protein [Deltaproteobacteria bacterium]